jgi:hypothetical protein
VKKTIDLPLYVWIQIHNGPRSITVLALLDTGCNTTLITRRVVDVLGLKGKTIPLRIGAFFGAAPSLPISIVRCQITPCKTRKPLFDVERALVVPELKGADFYVNWEKEKQKWSHLRDLDLPAVDSKQIGCFVGTNTPRALLQLESRIPDRGGPVAVLTPFGWTAMGEISYEPATNPDLVNTTCAATAVWQEDEADEAVQLWWTPELFNSTTKRQKRHSAEEARAIEILTQTIRNLGDRYEVGLPWKTEDIRLPNNRTSALRRKRNKNRFRLDPDFASKYTQAIEANVAAGFARRLTRSELEGPVGRTWYLPHFLVIKPNKPNKPRLVFDASSRHEGVSLNDGLINGPSLLTNLHDLLVKFRERPCPISMYIEKMFLQVRVREKDQAAFRYLWRRPGDSGPPVTYQMMVEIFGAASSPTSCSFVLRRLADDHPEYADIADKVINNFYVDNYLDSFNDADAAISCCHRLIELLKKGGFPLTQAMTSSRELWLSFPPKFRAKPALNIDLDDLPVERTLGLIWEGESDTFTFLLNIEKDADTKRKIVSSVASIFDPMGFLACVTVIPKIIIQDIWRLGRK